MVRSRPSSLPACTVEFLLLIEKKRPQKDSWTQVSQYFSTSNSLSIGSPSLFAWIGFETGCVFETGCETGGVEFHPSVGSFFSCIHSPVTQHRGTVHPACDASHCRPLNPSMPHVRPYISFPPIGGRTKISPQSVRMSIRPQGPTPSDIQTMIIG